MEGLDVLCGSITSPALKREVPVAGTISRGEDGKLRGILTCRSFSLSGFPDFILSYAVDEVDMDALPIRVVNLRTRSFGGPAYILDYVEREASVE